MQLRPGAHLYGGFIGVEIERSDRDSETNETVLDGRGGPDGDVRVYHVVRALGDGRLDGCTITGGLADADDEGTNQRGARGADAGTAGVLRPVLFGFFCVLGSMTLGISFGLLGLSLAYAIN